MPTYDEVIGELADQSTYDPFERAAARTRFGAKPLGGRQEGAATTLPENILFAAPRAAAGFTQAAFDRAAEQTGDVSQLSTDYDPRQMGAFLGAETALNTTGFGSPFAQAGALGSAGGKAVMGELASQAPPFYSAVERAVQGAKQNVAPGQQWAGYLRNQPGVKPEEMEVLGLGKLFEQPGATPKQAVLDQIAANKVEVGEVTKGGSALAAQEQQELNSLRQRMNTQELTAPEYRRIEELEHREAYGMSNTTKFQQYTLPGGENYREMLLTLPETKPKAVAEFEKFKRDIELKHNTHLDSPYDVAKWAGSDAADKYETLLRAAQDAQRQPGGMNFKSSHYDEPNILAHVRTNDRVIDGKKTLFVEEVQSDWHQKGRALGYHDQSAVDAAKVKLRAAEDSIRAGDDNALRQFDEASRELTAAQTAMHGVPDAPFKTTWPELAMKRIIREAAEKGYDKVAWTPGSVQAARYDLSKHVKKIDYNPESGKLWGYDHSNAAVIDTRVSNDKLADYIGKEAAEKLLSSQADKGWHRLEGTDLQVGGEGMKGFYDEILPATVNKLVKKHGGRVQQAEMFEGSPEKWVPFQRDDGVWQLRNADDGYEASLVYPTREAALADMRKGSKASVHTIDITPSLREQAMKGFPLFTAGGVAATGVLGELARQDQYQRR